MVNSLSLLQALQGAGQQAPGGSAGTPFRLAVIPVSYNAFSSNPSPYPTVRFEGETEVGERTYAYLNGYVPMPGDRVLMIPTGSTYTIVGKINSFDTQGFWTDQNSSGVELGGGAYFDSDEGLVLPAGMDITRGGRLIVDNHKFIHSQALTAGSNATINYANIGPALTAGFTKLYTGAETDLEITVKIGAYISAGTVPSAVRLGVRVGSTDYDVDNLTFQALNVHYAMIGTARVSGLAAGSYAVQPRIRATIASRTVQWDANDWIMLRAEEVPV
jgi:hypothetical protein